MSKCQMNKYRAGGRCGGSAQPGRGGDEASSAKVVSGALANLMAAREQQDRVFAPALPAAAAAVAAKQQAIVKQVAQPRPEKKECIDIILGGDF
jgi:hypothetical protein